MDVTMKTGLSGRIARLSWGKRSRKERIALCVGASLVVACACCVLTPHTAQAAPSFPGMLSDLMTFIVEWLTEPVKIFGGLIVDLVIKPQCVEVLELCSGNAVQWATYWVPVSGHGLSGSSIFGDEEFLDTVWNFLYGGGSPICSSISSVSYTILAIVFLFKTVQVVQQPDNSASGLPYVERVGWLGVQFSLFKWAIDHSYELSGQMFNVINAAVTAPAYAATVALGQADVASWSEGKEITALLLSAIGANAVGILLCFFLMIVMCGFCLFINISARMSIISRFFQLFIYLVFAPLFMSFFGLQETRQMSIQYLKKILSLSMSFAITVIILKIAPVVFVNQVGKVFLGGNWLGDSVMCVVYALITITALNKSGSFASDLLGA